MDNKKMIIPDFQFPELKTATDSETKKMYRKSVRTFIKKNSKSIPYFKAAYVIANTSVIFFYYYDIFFNFSKTYTPPYLIILLSIYLLFFIPPYFISIQFVKKNKYQYIKTFGSITKIYDCNIESDHLYFQVDFLDLKQNIQQRSFVIKYPEAPAQLMKYYHHELIGEAVEIRLTPDFKILLEIRTNQKQIEKLSIISYKFNRHTVWQLHHHDFLHTDFFYPESLVSIHFLREENESGYKLILKNFNKEFIVSSHTSHFDLVESFIFTPYSNFSSKHETLRSAYEKYKALKFSTTSENIELWKNQNMTMTKKEIILIYLKLILKALMSTAPVLGVILVAIINNTYNLVEQILLLICLAFSLFYYFILLRKSNLYPLQLNNEVRRPNLDY